MGAAEVAEGLRALAALLGVLSLVLSTYFGQPTTPVLGSLAPPLASEGPSTHLAYTQRDT